MFVQQHVPGEQCQSDFTRMGGLGITVASQVFDHLLYHCVLCYSNWESVTVCFSESFESLSTGLQDGVPTVTEQNSTLRAALGTA